MNQALMKQAIPSISLAMRTAAEARLEPKISERTEDWLRLAMATTVKKTLERIGQKNISESTISIIVEDLVEEAMTRYPHLTTTEISVAMKAGVMGELKTTSVHLTSQVAVSWLREWVEGPRRDVTAELARLTPKTELRIPESTEPLWKAGYIAYCEGRYPTNTAMMYEELVGEGLIILNSEQKQEYLQRAAEEDKREKNAVISRGETGFLREVAKTRLEEHKTLSLSTPPEWLVKDAKFHIVTDFFKARKEAEQCK